MWPCPPGHDLHARAGSVGLVSIAYLLSLAGSLGELCPASPRRAVMTPVGLAMPFRVYPPAERVRV